MSERVLTIVFRGMLVFHRAADHFEIGVLQSPGHFPRINTIKNGVLEFTRDLNDPTKSPIDPEHPKWRLEVDQPVGGVFTRVTAEPFDRKTHPDESDFRWIADLEGQDFYNTDLSSRLDTNNVVPVINVFNGLFYTRLRSPELLRREDQGSADPFGFIASVTGCDIQLRGRDARLIEEDTGRLIFTFDAEEQNTIYEVTNTPPDIIPMAGLAPHIHGEMAAMAMAAMAGAAHDHGGMASEGGTPDHFQLYYERLFSQQGLQGLRRFGFEPASPSLAGPAPSPALCGAIALGQRTDPLR